MRCLDERSAGLHPDEMARDSEKYYTGIAADSSLSIKLTGSWETVVGELDTFGASATARRE